MPGNINRYSDNVNDIPESVRYFATTPVVSEGYAFAPELRSGMLPGMTGDVIVEAILTERDRRGLTRNLLAKRAGLPSTTLFDALGKRRLNTDQLVAVLGALDWDLYDLAQAIDRAEGREPAQVFRHAREEIVITGKARPDLVDLDPADRVALDTIIEAAVRVIRRSSGGEPT